MKEKSVGGAGAMAAAVGIGALITVAASCLLLLPCAALVSGGKLGLDMMPLLTMAVCFLSSMLAALLAWKYLRARALLIGLGGAVLAFLFQLLIGLLLTGELPVSSQAASILLSLLLGGLLGAVIRLFKKKRRK